MYKTTHEIIDEIADLYNLKNRSVKPSDTNAEIEGSCRYNGPDGKCCAYAYMCIDPKTDLPAPLEGAGAEDLLEDKISQGRKEQLKSNGIDFSKLRQGQMMLKPEYRGHSTQFYQDIQFFHDSPLNWTDIGLSMEGHMRREKLKLEHPVKPIIRELQVMSFGSWTTVSESQYLSAINNNQEGRIIANFTLVGKNYDGL